MTKLEERISESAADYVLVEHSHWLEDEPKSTQSALEEAYKAGARAVLEMPELKALVKSLEFAAAEDMWESNQNFDEWFKYKYTKWYQDEIKESLEQWRSFIGEEWK